MARPRQKLDKQSEGEEVLDLLKKTSGGWKRERLLVIRMGLENKLGIREIAHQQGRSHQTIQSWFNAFREGGLESLLTKKKSTGRTRALDEEQMEEFRQAVDEKKFRTGPQAYAWLVEKFGVSFHPNNIYKYLGKLGAGLKVPRPCHAKGDPAKKTEFKETLTQKLADLELPKERPVRLWIYDEPSGARQTRQSRARRGRPEGSIKCVTGWLRLPAGRGL